MQLRTINFGTLLALATVVWVWGGMPQESHANPRVKQATKLYLQGSRQLKAGKYSSAVRSFNRAYQKLPGHPHFHCHRAQFLNYMGNAQERLRKPYNAMRSYYRSAYQSGCKNKATRNYAAGRYRSLYSRWMSSIQIKTTPPNARLIRLGGPGGDKTVGRTPFKKVFNPGKYRFKIRLYDHRTVFVNLTLRPGMHIKRNYKLVKGDDPVNRPEKVDVAPPPPVTGAPVATRRKVAKKKDDIGNLGRRVSSADVKGLDPTGGDLGLGTRRPAKPSAPVYKQAWFWAVVGTVTAAAIVIPIVIPKDQRVLVNQGKVF